MSETSKQAPVGIDLGTTFSAVAFLDASGRPETIRNSEGDLTTPSAVFFDHQRPIVGVEAVEAGLLEPDRLAQYAKRDVGEDYYDKEIRGKHLPAEVIQALVLRKLKADAELSLGEITEAVITVPAFFNEPCRKATQDAGRLAGLDVLDIINEPTAAAITYGVHQGFLGEDGKSEQAETVLVYDLGGGTFDVTVMEIKDGNFNTIATAGDVYLGGIDWDSRIVDFIAESFKAEHGTDPREDPQSIQELLRKANQAKHALTQREAVTIAFAHDGKRLRTELTQKEFSSRCEDLVERTLMTVQLVLDDAQTDWSKLTRLILVGGSTRMPMIREELERLSGMELDRSLSPDEAVSHGAALYAGMLMAGKKDKSGISVSNVNSHDLGVLAVDPQTGKPRRQIMIPRNSRLPARKMVRFRTHSDNQANVKIEIVEGGDDRGRNATKIGKCIVDDIPRGTPKGTNVDVRFDYTADGRLTVHASLPEIDRKITMTLDRAAGLTDEEIDQWSSRLDEGLSDAMLADLPQARGEDEAELVDAGASASEGEALDLPAESSAAEPSADEGTSSGSDETPDFSALETVSTPVTKAKLGNSPSTAKKSDSKAPATPVVAASGEKSSAPAKKSNAAAVLNAPKIQPVAPEKTVEKNDPPSKVRGNSKGKPAPVAAKSKPSDSAEIKIQLGDGQAAPTPKVTAEEINFMPADSKPAPSVANDQPKLNLDPKDAAPAVKADASDFAMLASLGGAKPASDSGEIPAISTESVSVVPSLNTSAPAGATKEKKSKGLFGRKKK